MTLEMLEPIWQDTAVDVTTEVNFIWSIANKLRGPYKSDKYKDVIIPMVIIRRLECALEATKDDVIKAFAKNNKYPVQALQRIAGMQFYNTSKFDLAELCNDSANIAANLKSYIEGFSSNVQDIFTKMEFNKQIDKLDHCNRLYAIIKAFSEIELHPDVVPSIKMGYIFEELLRRFSENLGAGDHYTGRDIIKMMVAVLLIEGSDDILEPGKVVTACDQACGTGGMLSTTFNAISALNPTADIRLFGHEIEAESYAICLAEMLIKGQNIENIRFQDTMIKDSFENQQMRYVIENPPFGEAWGGKDAGEGVEAAVKEEYAKANSRWGAGLPGTGDMQMLFLQSAVDKMDSHNGRAAIVSDGSPLFVGKTAQGESQIRRWLLEEDLIEAIIALPTDLFYNTGIATYVWVLSKNKRAERIGKVQLIDATSKAQKLRKALGNKKFEITPDFAKEIVTLYMNFEENELSKIFRNTEFLYREYAVMQPLQRSYAMTDERIENLQISGALSFLYDGGKVAELEEKDELTGKEEALLKKYLDNEQKYNDVLETLRGAENTDKYMSPEAFMPVLKATLGNFEFTAKDLETIAKGLSKMDKDAEIQRDKKGNIIYDPETKDIELVPYEEDIDTYMEREVLPHVPDAKAFFEEKLSGKKPVIKTGAEIPFTRYYYKYQQPTESRVLADRFVELEKSVSDRINQLFG